MSDSSRVSRRWILVVGALCAVVLGYFVLRDSGAQAGAEDTVSAQTGPNTEPRARARAEDGPDFDLARADKAALSGRVHDPQGRPIAGARVCVLASIADLRGLDEGAPRCVSSEADGHYRIEGLWPVEVEIVASAASYVPGRWQHEDRALRRKPMKLIAGQTREKLDIELKPGGVSLRGIVKDISGGEIEGAWIKSQRAVAYTSETGEFELWVEAGDVELEARSEGYAAGGVQAVAPGEFVELFLTPESVLVGRVIDAQTKEAVAGVVVSPSSGGRGGSWRGGGRQTQSGPEGRFRIDGLEPGTYKPSARNERFYGELAEQVHLGLGQTSEEIVIEVHAMAMIEGTIMIAGLDARPCEDGVVWVQEKGSVSRSGKTKQGEGHVRLEAVPPGTYQVYVRCEGYLSEDSYPDLVVTQAQQSGLVWEVREGLAIRGVVVDEAGEAIEGVNVMAQPVLSGSEARKQQTNGWETSLDDGSFEFSGLLAGNYELSVNNWGGRPGPLEASSVTLEGGADHNDARIILPATGTIRGRIIDARGEPVAGASLNASGIEARSRAGARSDDEGRFEFEYLRPGPTRVSATDGSRRWGGATLRKPGTSDDDVQGEVVEVLSNTEVEVELVVESRSGVIRGQVSDEDGGPVADAFIDIERMDEGSGRNASSARRSVRWSWGSQPVLTDQDGRFELDGLPDGKFVVRAHRKGGGEAVAEEVAVGASIDLVIESSAQLAGTVRLAGGGPAPERFTVTINDDSSGVSRQDSFFRTEGAWRLSEIPAGSYTVTASAGSGTDELELELAEGERREGVELMLEPLLTLKGRLVDLDSGEPVVGVGVFVAQQNFGFGMRDKDRENVSGADGRFVVEDAPSGLVYIVAWDLSGGQDSKYPGMWKPIRLAAEPQVQELGDIELVARRLESQQKPGDLGFKLREDEPGTEPDDERVVIALVRPGGPADGSGLAAGDEIVKVEGHDVRGLESNKWGALTRVSPGTSLSFELGDGRKVVITVGPPV